MVQGGLFEVYDPLLSSFLVTCVFSFFYILSSSSHDSMVHRLA